jgi:hypothetical protein
MPVTELLDRMSGLELAMHLELEEEEPQGFLGDRLMIGALICHLRNVNGGHGNGRPYRIDEVFPLPRTRDEAPQSLEQQKAIFASIFGKPK